MCIPIHQIERDAELARTTIIPPVPSDAYLDAHTAFLMSPIATRGPDGSRRPYNQSFERMGTGSPLPALDQNVSGGVDNPFRPGTSTSSNTGECACHTHVHTYTYIREHTHENTPALIHTHVHTRAHMHPRC